MASNSLDSLNNAQKEAALSKEGPVLVLAGAGAGKTKTITERIKHLILSGVAPSSILAITFTNKAAREMRERISRAIHEDPALNRPVTEDEKPFVSTFHSLGVRILRERFEEAGIKKHFTIFDKDDSKRAVKEAIVVLGHDPKVYEPGRFMSIISKEKGRGVTKSEYKQKEEKGWGKFSEVLEGIWAGYEKILRRDNALDFDDLLLKTRNLLRDNPKVREHYLNLWKYIHIDEYQDTNKVQYEISKLLTGPEHNIFVVGDIDQSIYSWRGADIKNILEFEKDYPEAKTIILEENYRSTKKILDAANKIIEKNKLRREKNLFTSNQEGESISIFKGFDEQSEAEFIATKAGEIIKTGERPDEIAVLYRANFQSRALEEAFLRQSIPYQLLGTKFFERKEIKDILSYLRAALSPDSLADIKRIINVPARGIGKATVAKLFAGDEASLPAATKIKIGKFRELLMEIKRVAEESSPSETIKFIIKASGLEAEWKESKREEDAERLENAYELANFASRYDLPRVDESPRVEAGGRPKDEAVLEFLSDAALQSDQDEMSDDGNAVRLMTVHASKGLEFNTVFIAGMEEGLFPHEKVERDGVTPEEAEEERRLFYVALTRARKKVFLTHAESRTIFGRRQVNVPSQFIFDIPEELLEEEGFDEGGWRRKPLLDIEF